jgi:hypothetical protein
MTEIELNGINGGMESRATVLGQYLAADGLTYMESGNLVKSTLGMFVAAGGGWLWAFGSAYDGFAGLFGW